MQALRKAIASFSSSFMQSAKRPSTADEDENSGGVQFASVTPQEVHRRLVTQGYCLLRNALPLASVQSYSKKIEDMYRSIVTRIEAGETVSDQDRVNIRNEQFKAVYGADYSFFNLLKNPKFAAVMNSIFGEGRYKPVTFECCTRSIHVNDVQRDKTSFSPLSVHFDGIYHETWPVFAVNFWIPFSACGKGTNSPGLSVYPVNHEKVRSSLGIESAADMGKKIASPANPRPMEALDPLLEKLYAAEQLIPLSPHFEVGDIMLISNWTLHSTFWDGKMSDCRRNLEIRFQGDSWNPLPAPASDI